MSMTYLDFDLHIWREGDRYAVEVTNSPAGQSEREYVSWPFPVEPSALLQQLEEIVRHSGPASGPVPTPAKTYLQEFGTDIFRVVFRNAGSVASAYNGSVAKLERHVTGLRINLRVDPPEWASLPWEYVFDERSYLCLNTDSPVVRRLSAARAGQAINLQERVRVLGVLVNLSGEWSLPDAENERRNLETIMEKSGVDFRWIPRPTPDSLMDAMQEGPWDIFHFIGHGGTEGGRDASGKFHSLGYVVMDNGFGQAVKLWADKLAMILDSGGIKLAVMNRCDSAHGGQATSVGEALVTAGIPIAIAMQFGISDASAARFSARFYNALTGGETAECALTFARQYIQVTSDAEWAIPIMFTQTAPCVFFSDSKPVARKSSVTSSSAQARAELRRLYKTA